VAPFLKLERREPKLAVVARTDSRKNWLGLCRRLPRSQRSLLNLLDVGNCGHRRYRVAVFQMELSRTGSSLGMDDGEMSHLVSDKALRATDVSQRGRWWMLCRHRVSGYITFSPSHPLSHHHTNQKPTTNNRFFKTFAFHSLL
jgi:hypothetical protein